MRTLKDCSIDELTGTPLHGAGYGAGEVRVPPGVVVENLPPVETAIFYRSLQGKGATPEQAVKVFSDPNNWRFEHLEKDGKVTGGAWVWQGNWIPPWEFAQHALAEAQKKGKE